MQRREFIAGLGTTAATFAFWTGAAPGQQPRMPVIGYIGPPYVTLDASLAAFRKGLSEFGYVEGRNVTIEYRPVEGHYERLPSILAELIQRRVDVIAAVDSTTAALAAKAATQTIPIVFRIGGDPVLAGLVPRLNRPGGNVTGATTLGNPLGQKQLEMLHELLPAGAVVAVLVNPANANAAREIEELQAAARLLGVRLLISNVSSPSDLDTAFASLGEQAIAGILTTAEPLFFQQRDHLVALVARRAVPAIFSDRFFVEAGGLMSYGTDIPEGFRIAGNYTGRILKGQKPADLPVQLAVKIELVINMKTAKALGITFPLTLLGRADAAIE
jgi:putative tryptophan/tyrosine transport system substrate-binding protein